LALSLPVTNYTIESDNNTIYFSDGIDEWVATVTPGIYNSETLLPAIKEAMEDTTYTGTITATYNETTCKLTIISTLPYLFQWGTTNSIAHFLGFPDANTT
jgi:hypothetical protein